MDPDRYRRSKEIFDAVCNRPKDERAAAVAAACGNDRLLESDVLAMLQVDDDSRFFDATAIERFERSMRRSAASGFPRAIGPYEILGILGTGGMGVVFRARQASPRRDVALKVMNGLGKGSDARRRFDLEGHFLARLNHEGIARIFEVGEAETVLGKEPYIAMELVEGPTLLEYAELHRLDVRARLLLIARIADAVEHAHQKGLIHRDLKPGNILVTADGQPKILDFASRERSARGRIPKR